MTSASLKLHLDDVRRAAREGAETGLGLAAEHLLGVSRRQVPHEEGTLERSGVAHVDGADLAAVVYYDTPYAVRQHEELTWQHDAGRKAKYLEDPMNSERDTMLALIRREISRRLT